MALDCVCEVAGFEPAVGEQRAATPNFGRRPRILIATDAWRPQVNGVVRTLEMLAEAADQMGIDILFLTPERFLTIGLPSYPEIRLALTTPGRIAAIIEAMRPDAIHIATEGSLGLLTRHYCSSRGLPFTTCYHTKYPEYLAARAPIPRAWSYGALRRFHGGASATMVATPTLQRELAAQGFENLVVWRRGIDLDPFLGAVRSPLAGIAGPVFLFVGRVAVEKNIEAFLDLDLPGTKIVVGDGPARANLMRRYPDALFPGKKSGAELIAYYAAADVFVFPSLTDTFGLVMLEALAAGTPVAAFPVTGPREVLGASGCGCLDEDLRAAVLGALTIDRQACRRYASRFTMQASARSFFTNIASVIPVPALAARLAGC